MSDTADHVQLPLPPPFIFLGYLVSALILERVVPFPTPWGLPLRIVGALALVAGLALAASAIAEMRKAHTTPDTSKPTTALVTGGPYRFSRNPIYLGFLLIYLGLTLLAGTIWGLILSPFLVGSITRSIIHAEEEYLRRKFETEYIQYSARVRQWV